MRKKHPGSNALRLSTHARTIGRIKSRAKTLAARRNGRKGGRPRKNPLP